MTDATYAIADARYNKGKLAVSCPSDTGYKTRAARLIGDGLGCRHTTRAGGYVASPSQVARFERLYAAGWDANSFSGELRHPDYPSLFFAWREADAIAVAINNSPKASAVILRALSGEVVMDIGQVDAPTKRALSALVNEGTLEKGRALWPGVYCGLIAKTAWGPIGSLPAGLNPKLVSGESAEEPIPPAVESAEHVAPPAVESATPSFRTGDVVEYVGTSFVREAGGVVGIIEEVNKGTVTIRYSIASRMNGMKLIAVPAEVVATSRPVTEFTPDVAPLPADPRARNLRPATPPAVVSAPLAVESTGRARVTMAAPANDNAPTPPASPAVMPAKLASGGGSVVDLADALDAKRAAISEASSPESNSRRVPAYCDPANETRGGKYEATRDLNMVEVTKRMRADIKALKLAKGFKVSVRLRRYSGGQSVDIQVTSAPTGFRVLSDKQASWQRQFPNDQWSAPLSNHEKISDEWLALSTQLGRIHAAYNRDNSDTMSDYFDSRYLGSVSMDWTLRNKLEAADAAKADGSYWAERS